MERAQNTALFAASAAALSIVGNLALYAGLKRFTNLNPTVQGAISAGIITGVGAVSLVGYGWVKENDNEVAAFIYLFTVPFFVTLALAPQVSRVFPEASVTWGQAGGYAVIGDVAYLVLIFKVFEEKTLKNIAKGT